MGKRTEKSCTRLQEGTVKQLHVIGVGTTGNNTSKLHTAEKTQISILIQKARLYLA